MPTLQTVKASVGDSGALNTDLNEALSEIWMDRDLSWLDFNERVLAEATDQRTPLLERAKFLAIFASNLDEFFMKRMAVLHHAIDADSLRLRETLRKKLICSLRKQAEYFEQHLVPELVAAGIYLRHWEDLTQKQREEANCYFDAQIAHAVTPLVLAGGDDFPFLSNLSLSLIFPLTNPATSRMTFGRVKVPSNFQSWVRLHSDADTTQFVFVRLHEVIAANLPKLYHGMSIGAITLVRLSREIELDSAAERDLSLIEQTISTLRKRRFQPVVRLEFAGAANSAIEKILKDQFHLSDGDIFEITADLDYANLFQIAALPLPALKDAPWEPLKPIALRQGPKDIFAAIRNGDFLVHHPYESFDFSVERFIEAAAKDPDTVVIKMTVYRVGDDTPFVKSLIKAAEAGKQVACVIELHARLDEERNLHWADALRKAGAHVDFGVEGLKIHAKTALVVRKESNGLRAYAHIGTGNYHVRTARLYADVGLFTCNPTLTNDVVWLFHYLTGHSDAPDCKNLLVAPSTMRARFLELIQRETQFARNGDRGRIIAKMNQLEDPAIIAALCEASSAGVSIDLIVRGFCCLKPGVPGHTANIRVRSIIGRFLEHSRIYYFGAGASTPLEAEFYIGSADWMLRNLSRRIEVVTPILEPTPKQRLWQILDTMLQDHRQAWELDSNGVYAQISGAPDALGSHKMLMDFTALTT